MTIEPQPAGPTFARCALRGARAGPKRSYGDIHIYKYTCTVQEEILAREIFGEIARLKHLANFTLTQQSDLLPLVLLETN